ncbi:TetR/AcrR family transcriptional regulator [Chitinimonas sp.]|uniref:TetR/AcrR family transcriptional regulator n=1 Tax=Chitinimonas sp. TaxID=1934313 RepID=UPI0035AE26FE
MTDHALAEPIELPADTPRRKTRAKGEKSRQAILTATMAVIAKRGLPAVTHRAIATEAGVPLSLTTYFFTSLQDLIEQTFDHFISVTASDNGQLLNQIAAYRERYQPEQLRSPQTLREVHREVSQALSDFILMMSAKHSVSIAVELNYLHLFRHNPALTAKVSAYRERQVSRIADLLRPYAPEQPEVDASLVLGLIHRLEFDCINRPDAMPRAQVEAEMARLVAFVLKVPAESQAETRNNRHEPAELLAG